MNITELAERVATEQDLDKAQARKVIEATLKAVVDAAKDGDEVKIGGFGSFKAQERAEREGRNPATGEAMTLAARRKLAFSPAKAVKIALNG